MFETYKLSDQNNVIAQPLEAYQVEDLIVELTYSFALLVNIVIYYAMDVVKIVNTRFQPPT